MTGDDLTFDGDFVSGKVPDAQTPWAMLKSTYLVEGDWAAQKPRVVLIFETLEAARIAHGVFLSLKPKAPA